MLKIFDNFFTNDECDAAVKTVMDNESMWYQCNWTSMYILGNSLFRKISFNESSIDYGNYFESEFFDAPVVNLLKQKLETMYNRVEFIPSFSRPGFQIIKLNEDKKPGVWHYDNMITCYPFEQVFEDYTGNFNEYFDQKLIFTTLLTDGKFTFDYYPETVSQFGKDFFDTSPIAPHCQGHRNLVGDDCPNADCPLTDFKTVHYKKGTMLLQEERFLHRVGIADLNGSSDLRVSLQGYGLVKNDVLYLVW
jgi:hypothetical protein